MAGTDRISALPLDIKVTILSGLTIKEAVRTSSLAHSWRHLWTFLPGLEVGPLSVDQNASRLADSRWFDLLHHLLTSLRGPFLYFAICNGFGADQSARLQALLDLAFQRGGVEVLAIRDLHGQVVVHLPYFHALEVLHLSDCDLSLPLGFQGFNKLLILELLQVCISNNDLQLLIDTSKQLSIFKCYLASDGDDPYSVTIRSQTLTNLEFGIYEAIERVRIDSAPRLEEVHITGADDLSEEFAPVTLGLLSGITMVTFLELTCDVLKTLSPIGARCALPVTFNNLRCLKLSMSTLAVEKGMYDVFTCLLRSAPLLEKLHIRSFDHEPSPSESHAILLSECVKKQDGFRCLNQSLTSVTIKMSKLDVITSIWMIHFLLLNANVLKLMMIEYNKGCEVEPNMIEELCKAKVTSSDAKLVIWRCKEKVKINVK
ncbi:F-box/LRR-repeat protein At3g26922-like [Carex rostrata]